MNNYNIKDGHVVIWKWIKCNFCVFLHFLLPQATLLCSVGVYGTFMMDCIIGPLECMHVNDWVQRAYANLSTTSFFHLPSFFFFFLFSWKFFPTTLIHPFSLAFMDLCTEIYAGTLVCTWVHIWLHTQTGCLTQLHCVALKAPLLCGHSD